MAKTKKQDNKTEKKTVARPPVVTVMGHVDHGKTSILDAIRKTNVTDKEHGGITQHIGAYQITHNDQPITFIDTPGHAAFTQMRSRGGKAADIVVLVVAATEGVKPQTVEAISHAKAANAPIIVAINKMDLTGADPSKVKQELTQHNVIAEDWGGDVVTVNVSAKTGENLDELLDNILLMAEIQELTGDESEELEAVIIESKLDRKRGVVVTAIARNGMLKIGDYVTASGHEAKIRSLMDDKGKMVKTAGLSKPVEILGFKDVPNVGDLIVAKGSELAELAVDEDRQEIVGQDTKKVIGIVLRADTQGTLEAVKAGLAQLVSENVDASYSIKFLLTSTGDVTDSDVLLADTTKGIVVGFNVKLHSSVQEIADSRGISVKVYNTIYELMDEVKDLLEGTASLDESKIKGRAEVLKTFKLPSGDIIAGSTVMAGALKVNSRIKIFDKNPANLGEFDEPLYIGSIKKLKIKRDDVNIVGKDVECGVLLKPQFDDISSGQFIEVL